MSMNPRKGTVTRAEAGIGAQHHRRQMSMNPRKGTVTFTTPVQPCDMSCQMPPGSVPAMVGQRVPGIASCTETKNQRFKSIGAS